MEIQFVGPQAKESDEKNTTEIENSASIVPRGPVLNPAPWRAELSTRFLQNNVLGQAASYSVARTHSSSEKFTVTVAKQL